MSYQNNWDPTEQDEGESEELDAILSLIMNDPAYLGLEPHTYNQLVQELSQNNVDQQAGETDLLVSI